MFLRFVSFDIDDDAHVRGGIFGAAYELRDSGRLPVYEAEVLREVIDWFGRHLERPARFSRSGGPPKAVCWFRSSAREYLKRTWELVAILENNDVAIEMIKSDQPGYVVYEDDFQLVAEPFGDLRRSK